MVTIRQQLVPAAVAARVTSSGTSRRTGITIQETANRARGANAAAHARLQARGNSRAASWHWTVDDTEAIQSFPHTARCWHTGDGTRGGYDTIGIEICVNEGGDYAQALRNAAELGIDSSPGEFYGHAASGHVRLALVQPDAALDLLERRAGTLRA